MQKINTQLSKSIKNDKGQSTIEFLMTFTFALGLSFLFIYQARNMTTGYLIHYATFMSSRVFLTYDKGLKDHENNINPAASMAEKVFNLYNLKKYDLDNAKFTVNKPKPSQNHSQLFTGVYFTYERKLTPLASVGGKEKAIFHSESFLGKEPLRSSCWEALCKAIGKSSCDNNMDVTLYDNGC